MVSQTYCRRNVSINSDLDVLNISDLPPLAEFMPLIRRMNPIFFLAQPVVGFRSKMVEETLKLLKVSFLAS
jgi:hypothetical protein